MHTAQWMIYGANGFTGELIARKAVEKKLTPILAGRDRAAIERLAGELNLASRIFDLSEGSHIEKNIEDCVVVLHCAGPFDQTCKPMVEAAIASSCHYTDIAGEIPVYEYLQTLSTEARRQNVMLLPGVGFDVVPTDCVAQQLKKELPDANTLELAFVGPNKAASGTIKTALRQIPLGSKIRENGELKTIPLFHKQRSVEIDNKKYTLFSIPWGDVSTAFFSTHIPNITVYTHFPAGQRFVGNLSLPFVRLLKNKTLLNIAEFLVEKLVPNPGKKYLASGYCYIWGEVQNAAGEKRVLRYKILDSYSFTAESSLICIENILKGKTQPGFQTPSLLWGGELLNQVRDTKKLTDAIQVDRPD